MAKTSVQQKRKARQKRTRAKVKGTPERPRLSVFRSAKHIYAQLLDDSAGKVVAAAHDGVIKEKKSGVDLARLVGKALAKAAKQQGIEKVVFDRGAYKYHGNIKALAEGAREGGLVF
jgi:large subunit ribosomal protein L18